MAEKFSTGFVQSVAENIRTSILPNFVIGIYDGMQPATAYDSEGSANLLCLITKDGGAFTGGVATNGLNFDTAVGGVLSKPSGDVWKGVGTAAAGASGVTATWFRVYANDYTTGASTTAKRYDGAIGTSTSFELRMTNPVIVQDVETTISSFTLTVPLV
jgi:hypothetical protein